MAKTLRQTSLFGIQDWKAIYQNYAESDLQSFDFETLRKSFIDYLTLYAPESYNDYVESSELVALMDVMAFMGQSLAFRNDLNCRESYLDTAERRNSVVKLANLVGYTPKRNTAAQGYLKILSVSTTENVYDYNGLNLSNLTVNWADPTNYSWQEQFTTIINAALVDSQKVGRPAKSVDSLGIRTDQYTVNFVTGYLPIVPFSSTVDGIDMPFEVVNCVATSEGLTYEPSPIANGVFNMLYRNDGLGFSSANTGYFFLFKQGVLQSQEFNLPERISNRVVDVNIEGINNQDVWLYQTDDVGTLNNEWVFVENIYTAATEQLPPDDRQIFTTTSRTNDQVTLLFGDGVFSEIPVGTFRTYVRASNGLEYIINPVNLQSIVIPLNYVSRTGQIETITFTCGLTEPVTNAQARESIEQIKQRAPARFYTQNRMVNGEDYTNFPFSSYNSIVKSSAVNRTSIGITRNLDLVDPTGKYSSTNIFGSDGALYEEQAVQTLEFTWLSTNEVYDSLSNQVRPQIASTASKQFYYANFDRYSIVDVKWNKSTHVVNETTGYFMDYNGDPVVVGPITTLNTKYIQVGSLVSFRPPDGYYFNADNELVAGVTADDAKYLIWASPSAIFGNGTAAGEGNLPNGQGPIVLDTYVPTGAIVVDVIPIFATDIPSSVLDQVVQQVALGRNFGLGYDNSQTDPLKRWYLITSQNLAVNAQFSLEYAQNTQGVNLDASWMIQGTVTDNKYTVVSRSLNYYFGSVIQTRFFYYFNQPIYDPKSGTVIKDFIKILKTNSKPDSNSPLASDIITPIIDQPIESDGYVDDFQVIVSYAQSLDNNVPLDPDFFDIIVEPSVSKQNKLVFLQQTVDFDDLERYLLVEKGTVSVAWQTKEQIELHEEEYLAGQVFYAYGQYPDKLITEQPFFKIVEDFQGIKSVIEDTSFVAKVGRQDLYFQYRHNSPLTTLIDPGNTNIIDLYVVTFDYYRAYQNWIKDTTGKVQMPLPPTLNYLTTTYANLQTYRMISDNLIINSVEFKPLFGAKAAEELRGIIKVVPAQGTVVSNSEIRNMVVTYMDNFFSIDVWNFGQTFYFSELSSYIHRNIGDIVSSIVIVPLNPQKSFGDLYEIRAQSNEIFVNAATVTDVEVIQALTSTNLRTAPGSGVI
jgi:hypothetical protein